MTKYRILQDGNKGFIPQARILFVFWTNMSYISYYTLEEARRFIAFVDERKEVRRKAKVRTVVEEF